MYKPEWLSKPADVLLEVWKKEADKDPRTEKARDPYDVIIVGSGYGGAVAAARLSACRDVRVCVLERGVEHVPGSFPNNFSDLPGHVRFSRFDDPVAKGVGEGLFDLRIGKDVSVLVANGLGGGSLINAGVAVEPFPDTFDERWPAKLRTSADGKMPLSEYAARALKALGTREPDTKKVTKFDRFQEFTQGLDPKKAQITVDASCIKCGDCATGCNVGAKRTLSKSYLHTARQQGAEIYTGVSVSHIERRDGAWSVWVAPTSDARPLKKRKLCAIRARTVILAAGSLGSTEILMRTKARSRDLRFSEHLGRGFSTNGDMINAVYKRGAAVNASAKEWEKLDKRDVGPTITGIAYDGKKRVVIEELAIPGALRRVFEEVLTTTALLEKFGRRDEDPHPARSRHDPAYAGPAGSAPDPGKLDPAAIDRDVVEGCQVFAAMGDDKAKGRLELVPGWDDPERVAKDGAIRVDWPNAGKQKIFRRQDKLFRERVKDDWTYLPNPLWQPLPAGLSKALSGTKPAGMLFSVHPLGGCPMGERVEDGVVDDIGQVFDPGSKSKYHDGLLVLDGSIVPGALGVNPLLTITALAERAMDEYIAQRKLAASTKAPEIIGDPPKVDAPIAAQAKTGLGFGERMGGKLSFGAEEHESTLTLQFDPIPDVADFLSQPLHKLDVRGELEVEGGNAARVTGEVQLLVQGASNSQDRTVGALLAYWRSRGWADLFGYLFGFLRKWSRKVMTLGVARDADEEDKEKDKGFFHVRKSIGALLGVVWKWIWKRPDWHKDAIEALDSWNYTKGYVDLASQVGETRYLFYRFELEQPLQGVGCKELLPAGAVLTGRKTLKYVVGGNPWRQLIDLEVLCRRQENEQPVRAGTLTVDPAYFFQGFSSRLQITGQRDLPAAWMDLASLFLFITRIFLKIHFWSFRLPEYQKYDPMRDVRRLPGKIPGLHMERHVVGYPEMPGDSGVFLPITRYYTGKDNPVPVLLIHGLGSGGIQFATRKVNPNLVQRLARWGFDVWVAELRTSIALPYSLDQWTLDEVARRDIPRIVDLVLDKTNARQTNVVAHCIGSAMFCSSVLDGRLQHVNGESKIRSAVLLQVGPLVTLSKGTRLRTLAAAPLVRFLPEGHLDFSVDDRAGWLESTIDRLLNTYPYPPDEARHHRLHAMPWRNLHIANCNRWAAIDGLMIRHENLGHRMLGALDEVLGHANITTWTQTVQYGVLERLTDSEARNAYVTAENVKRFLRFPVRFLHGADNDVFDPLTSYRSQELLRRVHGKDFTAEVQILPRYRHLDPLIGKNADDEVFRYISGFLVRDHAPFKDAPAPAELRYFLRRPLIGPVLGWLRQEKGTWHARVWCRVDDLRSPAAFVHVAVLRDKKVLRTKRIACPTEQDPKGPIATLSVGPIDTAMCMDVELGEGGHEYEVVVLSAHDAPGDPLSKDMEQAEAHAGKRRSAPEPHLRGSEAEIEAALGSSSEIARLRGDAAGGRSDGDEKIDCASVTPPKEKAETFRFALASCRYPGGALDRTRADAVFGAIGRLDPAPSALFLVGDQIYADATAGAFDPKDRRERFYEAYREAWTAENARDVLSRIPVYMAMDDHEAGNDWHPEDELATEPLAMHREGLNAFRQYQWLHGPGNKGQRKARPPEREDFWYHFELEGMPFFVCDTRSGRGGRTEMLDAAQFKALTDWLKSLVGKYDDKPKFIVSSSVVVPFTSDSQRALRSDGWDGFSSQMGALFKEIARLDLDSVVFLCGDSHLSNCSEIEIARGANVLRKAYCIVASPMYAPYPFANAKQQEFLPSNCGSPLGLPLGKEMRYKVDPDSWVETDGFALVSVTASEIKVEIGGKKMTFTLNQRQPVCVPAAELAKTPG